MLSTQTFGFTNLQNTASYSGSTLGFSASGAAGMSTPDGVSFTPPVKAANNALGPANSAGFGPSGFGAAGTGSDASGTTYAAVSQGKITVRGDAGTGRDSTEGLSRDTANANGSVQNTFDAQQVGNDMAIQQATAQVGMQVVGDVATALESSARDKVKGAQARLDAAKAAGDDAGAQQAQADLEAAKTQLTLWANDGAARIGAHAVVAGVGAALGGGNVLGAVGGTVAGDVAGNAVSGALPDTLGSNILSNAVAGVAGAVVGGALGGSAGAMSGANGALGADLYNRQVHEDSKAKEQTLAKKLADESGGKYTEQDIENQMARMNLTVDGQTESGGVRVATGVQPQDGTDWQPYGVNKAGQQVWAQTLGPGDPDLQAYIANGAQGSGLSCQVTTTGSNPGLMRAPDFVNFQVDYFVGSAWGTFTRDGNSFFGYGVNMGIPNAVGAGANVSVGYLNTTSVRPGQTNNFAGGYAGGGSAVYGGLGGGIMVSPGNGTATVIGFGAGTNVGKTDNPVSVGWGLSNDQGKTGIKW